MTKTLAAARRQERVKFKVPRSVQDAIPIRRIWPDGIFQVGNQYSKSWSFTDINYAIAGKDDKMAMFLDYCALLNALDSGAAAKITIHNRRIDKEDFETVGSAALARRRPRPLPRGIQRDAARPGHRHQQQHGARAVPDRQHRQAEYRRGPHLLCPRRHRPRHSSGQAQLGGGGAVHARPPAAAAGTFSRRANHAAFDFDLRGHAKLGHSFKDWLCPDSMEFAADNFKIDGRFGRVLYLQDYASYIKDSFISVLCDLDRSMMLSIDILPVPTDEAARQMQNTLLGVETNIANWQRKQNAANNWSATIPYDMGTPAKRDQGDAGRPDHPRPADDVWAGHAGSHGRQPAAARQRHRNAAICGAQAPVPAFHAALAAEGRS